MNHPSRLILAAWPAVFLFGASCGASGTSSKTGAGGTGVAGMTGQGGKTGTGGTTGAAGACVPTIPAIAWKNPYAGWTRGIPTATDPTFFPISAWLQGSWHATEMAALGINIYVGNNAGTDSLAAADLATLKAQGIYAIVGQDSVGLANIDDPSIVGWWMTPDEPDNAQSDGNGGYGPPVAPATLTTQYNRYKSADPTRPIYLGLGQGVAYDGWEGRGNNAPAESGYLPASDIVDFDIYPYNNCGGDSNEQVICGQFWLNAQGVDRLHGWSTRGQAVWTDIETTTIAAGPTTGPTPQQTKSEVWLSLIHGANGITYFLDTWNPTFREDGIFAAPAMVNAVTALNQQVKTLAPVLNSADIPNLVAVSSSNPDAPIDLMVKAHGQTLYLFAAIAGPGTATGGFLVDGMNGDGVVTVLGENRTFAVTNGSFGDAFAANDVHIYEIDLTAVTCN